MVVTGSDLERLDGTRPALSHRLGFWFTLQSRQIRQILQSNLLVEGF